MGAYESWIQQGEYVTVEGARIFRSMQGARDANVVLFLHGFPTSSFDWAEVAPALRADFRCVFFDFLGFGASDKPADVPYRYQAQTDLAVAIAERAVFAPTQRVFVVAHDYGVSVGQELLARAREGRLPFALAGALFMNGGLYPALHRPIAMQRALAGPAGVLLTRLVAKKTLARSLRRIVAVPKAFDDAAIDEHWKAIAYNDGAARSHALLGYIRERRVYGERWERALQQAAVPLSFVWGVEDPISGGHVLDRVREVLPGAEVCALRGVGHYPQLEAPGQVASAIRGAAQRAFARRP